MPLLTRVIAGLLDIALGIVLLILVFLALGDGGAFTLGRLRVSVRSPDNALIALATILLLRAATLRWGPLLGRWPAARVEARTAAWSARFGAWSTSLRPRTAGRIVMAVSLAALLLKIAIAAADPGFFSGDDVEIHEMTLGQLLRRPWPVWDLRSPVFPFAFVLPAQWIWSHAVTSDVGGLVLAGRLSVAVVSTLAVWLTYRIAAAEDRQALGYAVLAAALLASSKLHVAYGSTELPRPVAAVFVLAAFGLLGSPTTMRAVTGGALLGLAASLRFSEALFLVPAMTQLLVQRRVQAAVAVAVAGSLVFCGLVGLGDYLYWAEPFHSLRAASDYTLVRQLSSRGFQPAWWYLSSVARWTTLPVAALVLFGIPRNWRAAIWLAIPLVGLSMLPHKEERYAIPLVPFVCLLAADGVRRVLEELRSPALRLRAAPVLLAALLANLVLAAAGWRLARSNAAVAAARTLQAACAGQAPVAVEQLWRMGGRLYFSARPAADLEPSRVGEPDYLLPSLESAGCIALDERTLQRHPAVTALIESRGFVSVPLPESAGYRAWQSTEP